MTQDAIRGLLGFIRRWEAFFGSAIYCEDGVAESLYASLPPGEADLTASASRRDEDRLVNAEVRRMWRSPEREAVSRVGVNAETPAGLVGGNISIKVGKVKVLFSASLPLLDSFSAAMSASCGCKVDNAVSGGVFICSLP